MPNAWIASVRLLGIIHVHTTGNANLDLLGTVNLDDRIRHQLEH